MGAVILRAQHCLTCGGPMPTTSRVDRRYCKGACRTLAYRVRRRVKEAAPPGPLEPAWAEPNAVVKTMLTSLAQIQARVLDFAHQLEGEELFARRPVRTESRPGAQKDPVLPFDKELRSEQEVPQDAAAEKGEGEDVDEDEDNEEVDELDEEDVYAALRSLLEEAKADALKATARAVKAEERSASLEAELARMCEQRGVALAASSAVPKPELQLRPDRQPTHTPPIQPSMVQPSNAKLEGQLEAVTQQRDKLQNDLFAERERASQMERQLHTLHREANEALGQMKNQKEHFQGENERLNARVRELTAAQQRANAALAQWDQIDAESIRLTNQSQLLQQENTLLRAEVERLRPPLALSDPLVVLMKDRAKALHWLAVFQMRTRETVTGRLLPNYDDASILDAAIQHAFEARRDLYFRPVWGDTPKPRWVHEDCLLDPESEKKVLKEAESRNREISLTLEYARTRAGETL
jgi:predicted nucleic acid-binding Zn ribbon protein